MARLGPSRHRGSHARAARSVRAHGAPSRHPHDLLTLQRLVGNAATLTLLRNPETALSIQRCLGEDCEAAVAGAVAVARAPAPPAAPKAAAPKAPQQDLCDLSLFAGPMVGPPAPGSPPALDHPDIAWIEKIQGPTTDPLQNQIDDQFSAMDLKFAWEKSPRLSGESAARQKTEKEEKAKIDACVKQEEKKIKAIADPTARRAAEQALDQKKIELAARLQTVLSEQHEEFVTGRAKNRMIFMHTLSCFLGSFDNVRNHFSKIRPAQVAPGSDVWLHEDAKARLEKVEQELVNDYGTHVPRSWVSQSLRDRHLAKHGTGKMAHPLGFSVDFVTTENPMITDPSKVRLLAMVTKGKSTLKLPAPEPTKEQKKRGETPDYRATIREMGKDAAAGTFDETKYAAFLTKFDEEFKALSKAADAFKASIPQENKARLLEIEKQYTKDRLELNGALAGKVKEEKGARAAAKADLAKGLKKGQKVDPAAIEKDPRVVGAVAAVAQAQDKRNALDTEMKKGLSEVFAPWLQDIQKEIDKINGAVPGGDLDKVPTVKQLDAIIVVLDTLRAKEARIAELEKKPGTEKKVEALRLEVSALVTKHDPSFAMLQQLGPALKFGGPSDPVSVRLQQARWIRKWRLDNQGPIAEMGEWRTLQRSLTDFNFVYKSEEAAKNVSIKQLVTEGFFSGQAETIEEPVKGTALDRERFNIRFFKTMLKYGWDPGAAWSAKSFDPMHFDFSEGLTSIPGKGPQCKFPEAVGK